MESWVRERLGEKRARRRWQAIRQESSLAGHCERVIGPKLTNLFLASAKLHPNQDNKFRARPRYPLFFPMHCYFSSLPEV